MVTGGGLTYLGWLRGTAGLGQGSTATPQQIIEDAKAAAERAKERLRTQQHILQKVEEQSR